MKNEKAITLIALVITIILMLILIATIGMSGIKSINEAEENKQLSELEMVQSAVLRQYYKYQSTKNPNDLIGEPVVDINEVKGLIVDMNAQSTKDDVSLVELPDNVTAEEKQYRILTPSTLEYINVSNAEDTYIVNYVSGEVINQSSLVSVYGFPLYTRAKVNSNNNMLEGDLSEWND